MKILIKGKKNYLATILIGEKYFNKWKKYVYPSWKIYCKKNKEVLEKIYILNLNLCNLPVHTNYKSFIKVS